VENELSSVGNNGRTTSFTYDAAGLRTKTIAPSGVTTYYPFPGYEEEVNGRTTTRHITYSVGRAGGGTACMGGRPQQRDSS
jgi:YD repeat-containing protein